ncbi:amino acid adenylation domain-containing protein, partial [Lysinibacillus xylanilyticus]|uniref:amino acid adenylation domain-containing protein n=1 Tax=Lysinibacillus xylanilyticus TaxID=582475 RepID=UPI003825AB8B
VERTPNEIAVVWEGQSLTYKELNEKANQLARAIKSKGIQEGSLVALMIENSPEVILSMLAVLKSGCVYLPIDPEYPKERIEYILKDSQAVMMICESSKMEGIRFNGEHVDVFKKIENESKSNLDSDTYEIAYMMYTSGSTGNPKGVRVTQKGLVNYIYWSKKAYLNNGEVIAMPLYSSISFDLTVTSIYLPLISGNKIIVFNGEDKAEIIKEILTNKEIKVMKLTPSHLKLLEDDNYTESKVNRLIVGGEILKTDLAQNIYSKFKGNVEIYNEYGPTEATVGCIVYKYDYKSNQRSVVPVGKPIDNAKAYLLDANLKPVLPGQVGQLFLAGDCLAEGYHGKTEDTLKAFIENPFVEGEKMYKTGDFARRLTDGDLEYIGREDYQVKFLGHRIELREIENALLSHKLIKDSRVVLNEDSSIEPYLCAYIVVDGKLTISDLRNHLINKVPKYMIPARFRMVEKIALNINGKVELAELEERAVDVELGVEYEGPGNELETKLVKLWGEILDTEYNIGTNINFFVLGGDSLKATKLATRIYKKFGVNIGLKEIFQNPTIRELSRVIKESKKSSSLLVIKQNNLNYLEASSSQKRMYVLQRMNDLSVNYNIPECIEIEGSLDISKLKKVFTTLIKRHDILRTSFNVVDGVIMQTIHQDSNLAFEYFSNGDLDIEKVISEFVKPFNLSEAPLFRVGLVKVSEFKHILILDFHHIISDEVTMNIFTSEFISLYENKELEYPKFQYKDYVGWQEQLRNTEEYKKQESYWLERFSDEIPVLNLPTDYTRKAKLAQQGSTINIPLTSDLTSKLKELSRETNSTMYMIILSVINVLLSKYSSQEDIVIGSPISGRTHVDFEETMGLFVNTLPIRNYPKGEKIFMQFLNEVKEHALSAYDNQEFPFDELVSKITSNRDISRNAIFDVMFTMQNENIIDYRTNDIKLTKFKHELQVSKFDLSFFAIELEGCLEISIQYSTDLFKKRTIESLLEHLIGLMEQIVDKPETQIKDLQIISGLERKQQFKDFNCHYENRNYIDKTVMSVFEGVVRETPDAIAVVAGDEKILYKTLNEKGNQLANHLIERGLKQNETVALMTNNTIEMIIGMVGILKAGGVYLPIDLDSPAKRKEFILKDSQTNILLIDNSDINWSLDFEFTGFVININDSKVFDNSGENYEINSKADDLAYIMYTSGSTGNPKGVLIENKSIVRLVKDINYMTIKEGDKILQTGSIAFDASTFEIWGALLNGLELHLGNKINQLNLKETENYIKSNDINIIWLTSSLFNVISQERPELFSRLSYLLVGGEALSVENINKIKRAYKDIKIINGYGPTENTTFTTCFQIDSELSKIPIGKPIQNTQVLILDKHNNLQPIGVPGELCIAGEGVARGYLNNP